MSKIEELVYSAYEYGKREVLFKKVNKIRQQYPTKSLDEVYDQAYQEIMNT
jgi:hypothetical protein